MPLLRLRSTFGTGEAMEQLNGDCSMPGLVQDGRIQRHN